MFSNFEMELWLFKTKICMYFSQYFNRCDIHRYLPNLSWYPEWRNGCISPQRSRKKACFPRFFSNECNSVLLMNLVMTKWLQNFKQCQKDYINGFHFISRKCCKDSRWCYGWHHKILQGSHYFLTWSILNNLHFIWHMY